MWCMFCWGKKLILKASLKLSWEWPSSQFFARLWWDGGERERLFCTSVGQSFRLCHRGKTLKTFPFISLREIFYAFDIFFFPMRWSRLQTNIQTFSVCFRWNLFSFLNPFNDLFSPICFLTVLPFFRSEIHLGFCKRGEKKSFAWFFVYVLACLRARSFSSQSVKKPT